jgi:hypothetical protein
LLIIVKFNILIIEYSIINSRDVYEFRQMVFSTGRGIGRGVGFVCLEWVPGAYQQSI